jgi:transcriptional regulator with XRE-family HTH domain
MPDFNFRHATFKQTLVYAKLLSRMTNEEISEASGISLAQVARYFQENDAYSPAPALVPALCRAMRNTVLVDWQNAQVEDLRPVKAISNVQDPPWLSRAHGKQDGGV